MSFQPDEQIFRFLFASSAFFYGAVETENFELTVAFPSFDRKGNEQSAQTGPFRSSKFIFSVRVPPREPGQNHYPMFDWVGEEASALLGAFFGKHIINLGHVQAGRFLTFPNNLEGPCWPHNKPPFNDNPRKPDGPEINLTQAKNLLSAYVTMEREGPQALILRASEFYRISLENYSDRPEMAFTLLISTLECLVDLRTYSEKDLFDDKFLLDLKMIEEHCPKGVSITKNLKSRLYQVRRKVAAIVDTMVPDSFFTQREAEVAYGLITDRRDLRERILAAYDLRSKLLHTGNRDGLWFVAHDHAGTEVGLGNPVLNKGDIEKLISKSVNLVGLERIVSCVLHTAIKDWLSGKNCETD